MNPILRRVLTAIFIALCGALILLTAQGYWQLYSGNSGLILPSGDPVGGDFIAFYTGGHLLNESLDLSHLFNFQVQREYQLHLIQENRAYLPNLTAPFLPFVYPPVVALPFMLLASQPFALAYVAWVIISILLFIVSIELLVRSEAKSLEKYRALVYLAGFSFTPFSIDTLAGGQLSAVGLLVVSAVYFLLKRERYLLAGMVASCTYYKAPLFLLLILGLVLLCPKKFGKGVLLGGLMILSVEFSLFGIDGYLQYVSFVSDYISGNTALLGFQLPSHLGVGLVAPLQKITDWAVCVSLLVSALWLFAAVRRRGVQERITPLAFSALLTASMACSLQINNYDLTLLTVSLILWASAIANGTPLVQRSLLSLCLLLAFLHSTGVTPEGLLLPLLFLLTTSSEFFVVDLPESQTPQ